MPGQPQFGGEPVTNIRNVKSPHWRRWLGQASRCIVPATSFCEYADTNPRKTPGAGSARSSEQMRQFGSVAWHHQQSCRTEFPSSRFTYLLGSQRVFSSSQSNLNYALSE
jgi:putative SOS response-associated peptidase YedK